MHPRSLLRQLTRIPLEKPCDTPWESMVGSDKVRRCGSCDRDVYSLSDMSELEAELRLLNSGEEVPCIRYLRDEDGQVRHYAAPPPPLRFRLASAPARALVAATAFGSGLIASEASAQDQGKDNPPVQCVMLNALEPAPAAPAPASGAAAAPAAAPAPAAAAARVPVSPPPPPIPLAGAAPPPRQPIAYGTLTIRSKVPRDLDIQGLKLKAPLDQFRMTPGNFVVEVKGPGKKKRTLKFTVSLNQLTTLDLDKR